VAHQTATIVTGLGTAPASLGEAQQRIAAGRAKADEVAAQAGAELGMHAVAQQLRQVGGGVIPVEFVLEHGDGPQETDVSGRPELPTLYDDRGRSLAIGVGDQSSLLVWTEDDSDGSSLLSQGVTQGGGDEVGFFYGNQYSYFPATALIPIDLAREAMRQFITSGTRPTVVAWQDP
jgi:hypothetical protein